MKLVYDIETNGLDPDTIWCIVAHDILTGTTYKFADTGNYHGMVSDGVSFLSRADLLIGHNMIVTSIGKLICSTSEYIMSHNAPYSIRVKPVRFDVIY